MKPGVEPFDRNTLDYYAEAKPLYAAKGPNGTSRHLAAFMKRLVPGAHVLDLGCGGGRDAEAMIANGFIVDATDGTEAIALQAEARLNQPVRVMRFDELDAIKEYDAVWAHASLLHVPKEALPDVLRLIYQALKPGGIHFANYQGVDREPDSTGRYFNYMTVEEARKIYAESADWMVLDLREDSGGTCTSPWVVVTVQRL